MARRSLRTAAALAASLLLAAPLAAQDGASPLLPPDHWAVRAAWRLEAQGLAPDFFPAQGPVPRAAVEAALRHAADHADPASAGRVGAAYRRFLDEFREMDPARADGGPAFSAAAGVEGRALEGRLAPPRRTFSPALPLDDDADVGLVAAAAVRVSPALAAFAELRAETGDVRMHRWEAVARLGPVAFSAGRQPVGYGPAHAGGLVLTPTEPMARLEVRTDRPLRAPVLGPVTFHTFLTRLHEPRHRGDPWMWGARVAARPHPRLTVGLNRAAIFGGDSVPEPTNLENVAEMLVGVIRQRFDNQVVAMDFRWRLPTDGTLPATAYLEWGADDGAGAWFDVPAITGGVLFPAIPGAPSLSVGAEAAYFAVTCCGNGPWYYNTSQRGNWAVRDRLLGHPLAGEGREARLYAAADLLDARLRLGGDVFGRERGAEYREERGNLFYPQRGRSAGGSVDASFRASARTELRVRAYREQGGDWHEQGVEADVRWFF